MRDHWPSSSEDLSIPLIPSPNRPANNMPRTTKNSPKQSDDDNDSYDDESFVVRRKQKPPDGEDDSRSHTSKASKASSRQSSVDPPPHFDNSSPTRRRSSPSMYSDDEEESLEEIQEEEEQEENDATSLAELTSSYGSGIDLHPHHKRRSSNHNSSSSGGHRRSSSSSNNNNNNRSHHRSSRNNEGGHSSSDDKQRRHNHRGSTSSGGKYSGSDRESRRRRKPQTYYDDEDIFSELDNKSSVSAARQRYSSRSLGGRNGNTNTRSGGRSSRNTNNSSGAILSRLNDVPIIGQYIPQILTFFDGVNIKTVLLCIVGMFMVMKFNSSNAVQPPPSVGGIDAQVSRAAAITTTVGLNEGGLDGTPSLRGAALDGIETNDNNEVGTIEGEEGKPPPPPPPVSSSTTETTTYQQPAAAYATPDGSTTTTSQQQQPPQAGSYAVPIGSTISQSPLEQQIQPGALGEVGALGSATTLTGQPPPVSSTSGGVVDPNQPIPLSSASLNSNQMAIPPAVAAITGDGSGMLASPDPNQPIGGVTMQLGGLPPDVMGGGSSNSVPLPPEAPAMPMAVPEEAPPPAMPTSDAVVPPVVVPEVATATPEVVASVGDSLLPLLSNFKDSWDPYETTDIPMFWHIPKAGGSSIKDAMGGCHRFVQATEFGITDGHDQDTEVAIVYPAIPGFADSDRSPFVNIDSSTPHGIARAKSLGFADAQLADVVVSPFVFETNDLFTQTAKGRLFSVFRHPIDRAVSMFYYIRVADWEPSYAPEMKDWTLEQYATSPNIENNWMTRQLSNQLGGELTDDNLNKAMEVVRTKFMVGLMSQIEPTMARFEKAFRWKYHVNPPNQEACRERLMSGGSNSNKSNKEPVDENHPAWELLAQQNNFDLQLYAYIEQLFVEQNAFVADLPDDFRNVDATCCKCGPPTFPPEGFTCPVAVKNSGR